MKRLVLIFLFLLSGSAVGQPPRRFMLPSFEPPPAPINLAPVVAPEWRLLAHAAVRTDIGLTVPQAKALDFFEAPPTGAIADCTLGLVPTVFVRATLGQARDDFFTAGLTKAQRTRLRQIFYQLKEREFGAHAAFAMAARDLGLRADQVEDVGILKSLRVDEIAKLVTSGERFEKMKGQVATANGDTFEKMGEMLTRAQRERLSELRGTSFEGKVEINALVTGPAIRYPGHLFGLYDLELRYLKHPALAAELKLTPEQSKEIETGLAEWERVGEGPGPESERALMRHFHSDGVLHKALTAKQLGRLNQIMLQRRARAGMGAACGHPAAVEALKLSPAELFQLRAGRTPDEVLTKGQVTALSKLFGEPFELPADVSDPILPVVKGPLASGPPPAFGQNFLRVSDRLKLSADQVKRLKELAEDEPKVFDLIQRELSFAETAPVIGAGRGLSTAGAVADQYRAAVEKQCWDVLDEKQRSLAREIYGRRK